LDSRNKKKALEKKLKGAHARDLAINRANGYQDIDRN